MANFNLLNDYWRFHLRLNASKLTPIPSNEKNYAQLSSWLSRWQSRRCYQTPNYQYVSCLYGKKSKPFSIIDTHSGAGAYKLADDFSDKNKEYETGIAKLWSLQDAPESVINYVEAVKKFNLETIRMN